MAIERMNYFKGEFLDASDFGCEQKYHVDMRRRHNQYLHTTGIVYGLTVTAGTGRVTVAPGMAIDKSGRELILENPLDVPVTSIGDIAIKFKEDLALDNTDPNFPGKKRWVEGVVSIAGSDPDAIILAKVTNITTNPVTLDPRFIPPYSGPTAMGNLDVKGNLSVQGNLTVQGETTVDKTERMQGNVVLGDEDADTVTVEGTLLTGHSSGRLQIGSPLSITAPGTSLEVTGTVRAAKFQGDGSGLTGISTSTDTTRVAKAGDTMTGALSITAVGTGLSVTGNVGIGTASPARKLHVEGGISSRGFPANDTTPNLDSMLELVNRGSGGNPLSWTLYTAAVGGGFGVNPNAFEIWEYPATKSRFQIRPGGNTILVPGEGNVGIGTGTVVPISALHIGLAKSVRCELGTGQKLSLGGNGSFEIDAPGVVGGRLTVTNDGNVGIGITVPRNKLHVKGTICLEDSIDPEFGAWSDIFFYQGAVQHSQVRNAPAAFIVGTALKKPLWLQTNSSTRVIINAEGNVGIGTTSPGAKLDVNGGIYAGNSDIYFTKTDHSHSGIGNTAGYAAIENAADPYNALMILGRATGGTPNRIVKLWDYLQVNGLFACTGSIAGGGTTTGWVLGAWGTDNWLRITTSQAGNIYHDLAVNHFWAAGAGRFDLAEVTPVKTEDELEQGDVVVIDKADGLRVTRSKKPSDTSVYGIVSSYKTASMIIGGGGPETVIKESDKLPIALIGRVKAKVSSEAGDVQIGDLLTTSSTPGHLMRCSNISKCVGAIVGKALEPLASDKGIITILVALQ